MTFLRSFAVNVAAAAVVWAWGFATGNAVAEILPRVRDLR